MNISTKTEHTSFEDLGDGFFVASSKKHRFGSDAFLLANFANVLKKDTVCEIGTGCGIISILICKKYQPLKIYAFDILKSATDLALQSVIKSKLEDKIIVINQDIKNIDKKYHHMFDKIICNPPYKPLNSGTISSSLSDKIIRHETSLSINELCRSAYKLLKFHGSLFLTSRTERLCDVLYTMRQNKLEPKKLQFCAHEKSYPPWLFLVEGKKNSKPFLKILPSHFNL